MWTTVTRASPAGQDKFHHRTTLATEPQPMMGVQKPVHGQAPSPARRLWQNVRGRLTAMTTRRGYNDTDANRNNLQSTSTESCGNSIISSSYVSAFSSPAAREAFAKYEMDMKVRSAGSDEQERIHSEGIVVGHTTSYGNSSTDSSEFDDYDEKKAIEREGGNKKSYTLYLPENLHIKSSNRNRSVSRDDDDETTCSGFEAAASTGEEDDEAKSEYISCSDTISTLSAPSRAAHMHSNNRKLQLLAMMNDLDVDVAPVRIPSSIQVGKTKKDKHVIKKDRKEI